MEFYLKFNWFLCNFWFFNIKILSFLVLKYKNKIIFLENILIVVIVGIFNVKYLKLI